MQSVTGSSFRILLLKLRQRNLIGRQLGVTFAENRNRSRLQWSADRRASHQRQRGPRRAIAHGSKSPPDPRRCEPAAASILLQRKRKVERRRRGRSRSAHATLCHPASLSRRKCPPEQWTGTGGGPCPVLVTMMKHERSPLQGTPWGASQFTSIHPGTHRKRKSPIFNSARRTVSNRRLGRSGGFS